MGDGCGYPLMASSLQALLSLPHPLRCLVKALKGIERLVANSLPPLILLWMESTTSSSQSLKSKFPQVSPMIRPARDPEKQGAHAKPSGDLKPHDQVRGKSPNTSHVITCDQSRDLIHFGQARSPLINKWKTMGTVFNQQRHVTPVKG
jgi:hypothetical protein